MVVGDDRQRLLRSGRDRLPATSAPLASRVRTASCATMRPSFPKAALPPVWSPCQCVLSTYSSFPLFSLRIAAWIFGTSGANWSSTISTPSGPTETPMLPPAPFSMCTLPATGWTSPGSSQGRAAARARGWAAGRGRRRGLSCGRTPGGTSRSGTLTAPTRAKPFSLLPVPGAVDHVHGARQRGRRVARTVAQVVGDRVRALDPAVHVAHLVTRAGTCV